MALIPGGNKHHICVAVKKANETNKKGVFLGLSGKWCVGIDNPTISKKAKPIVVAFQSESKEEAIKFNAKLKRLAKKEQPVKVRIRDILWDIKV
jgi:hypothetical protein